MIRHGRRFYYLNLKGDISCSFMDFNSLEFWQLWDYGNVFLTRQNANKMLKSFKTKLSFHRRRTIPLEVYPGDLALFQKIQEKKRLGYSMPQIAKMLHKEEEEIRVLYSIYDSHKHEISKLGLQRRLDTYRG
jgi:hypothetical protein